MLILGDNVFSVVEKYGFKVYEFSELDSTNNEAERLMGPDLEDRTVILTYKQTAGRGQMGNSWESEPDKNVLMTVVFRPDELAVENQFDLSMMISLAVYDVVSRYVQGCTIKWPNDIYVGEKKIAGILIEQNIKGRFVETSLCGLGLNVNQGKFSESLPNPVSLYQLLERELPRENVRDELLEAIDRRYRWLLDDNSLRHDYLNVLYRRTGIYDWEDESGVFQAEIEGINEYGQLVLLDSDQQKRVYGFKEVKYLD